MDAAGDLLGGLFALDGLLFVGLVVCGAFVLARALLARVDWKSTRHAQKASDHDERTRSKVGPALKPNSYRPNFAGSHFANREQ